MKTQEQIINHNNGDITIVQTYQASFKAAKKFRIPRKVKKHNKKDANQFWNGNVTKFYNHGTLWPMGNILPESDPIRDITAAFNYFKNKGYQS